jgi:hypothetical protein
MSDTTEDIQHALKKFEGEFEVKWVNDHSALASFYNINICHEAKKLLDNRPGPFSISRIVKPEVEGETTEQPKAQPAKRFTNSKRRKHVIDEDLEEEEEEKTDTATEEAKETGPAPPVSTEASESVIAPPEKPVMEVEEEAIPEAGVESTQ